MTFLNTNMTNELINNVLQFLEPGEILDCRGINSRYKMIVDSSENLFSAEARTRKAAHELMIDKRRVKDAYSSFLDVLQLNLRRKKTELETKRKSLFGLVAPKIQFLSALFPSIKTEVSLQKALEKHMADITTLLPEGRSLFEKCQKEWMAANIKYRKLVQQYKKTKLFEQVNNKIYSLFGGKAIFEALPVLDIGKKMGRTDYIDFITPRDMTAPIMRGIDRYKRPFFALRATRDDAQLVQTFFQRYTDEVVWVDGHDRGRIIDTVDYLIDSDGTCREHVFANLTSLIKNKKFEDYTI